MNLFAEHSRSLVRAALLAALGAVALFAGEMDNGESYYLQKEYRRAVECYNRALSAKLNDNNKAMCWFMLGQCHTQLKAYGEAEKCFRKVISEFPKTDWLAEAYMGYGDACYKSKKFGDALKQYRNCQTAAYMKRSGSLVLYKTALCQRQLGDSKGAAESEKKLASQYPRSLEARLLLKKGATTAVTASASQTAPKTGAISTASKTSTASSSKTTSTTTSSSSSKAATSGKTKFAVQVSYTPKLAGANQYAAQLKAKGYSKAYVRAGKSGYSVLVGNYDTKDEAQKVCAKIRKSEKNDSYVISI